MAQRTEQISLHLNAYLTAHSSPPDAVLRELANATAALFPTETGLAFIDADKGGYLGYWREVVPRIRPGGLIMVDNTFSHGRVIDAGNDNPLVIAVRDFNDHAAADDRVDLVMVPIGDGLTLARKRD